MNLLDTNYQDIWKSHFCERGYSSLTPQNYSRHNVYSRVVNSFEASLSNCHLGIRIDIF